MRKYQSSSGKSVESSSNNNNASGGGKGNNNNNKRQNNQSGSGGGKSKQNQQQGNNNDDVNKTKIPLQAVVLADSFTRTLRPVTVEIPKVLVPLCNIPLLEYTLEFLAANGIEEVIIFCCWRAHDIEEFINQSKWKTCKVPVIKTVSFRKATTAGDAIRELESMSLVKSDPFVLISGDVVANVDILPVIEEHKSRREVDKQCAMTMIFCKGTGTGSLAKTSTIDDDLVVAVNSETNQLLRYENSSDDSSIIINDARDLFKNLGPSIDIFYGLRDCFIDICSPEVLTQIADNYDYQDLRKDFVRLETQNHELGYKFFANIVTSPRQYAARVHDARTYHAVSQDVLHRWTYPRAPDSNWGTVMTTYSMTKGFVYREMDIQVSRTAQIGQSTMIGANSKLGANVQVTRSVIGRNCTIADGAQIIDSYLWDGVIVEKDAKIDRSIICSGAIIKEGAMIPRGCIISFKAVIGTRKILSPFTRITTLPLSNEDEDEWSAHSEVEEEEEEEEGDFDHRQDNGSEFLQSSEDGSYRESSVKKPSSRSLQLIQRESGEEVTESIIVGEDGLGRKYDQIEEDSQADPDEGDAQNDFAGAPAWMIPALRQGLKQDPPILAHYFTLRSSMGIVELEKAREMLWTELPDELKEQDEISSKDISNSTRLIEDDDDDTVILRFIQAIAEFISSFEHSRLSIENRFSNEPSEISREMKKIMDALQLEITSYQKAENRTLADVLFALVPAILKPVLKFEPKSEVEAMKNIKERLLRYHPLLTALLGAYTKDVSKFQHALIKAIELFCLFGENASFVALCSDESASHISPNTKPVLQNTFPFLLVVLFQGNDALVEKEGLNLWIKEKESSSNPTSLMLYKLPRTQIIIQDILNEEEEDDDDDDDDDDNEEEEEDDL